MVSFVLNFNTFFAKDANDQNPDQKATYNHTTGYATSQPRASTGLILALKARKLRWTMLAVPCNALFCSVIITHHFAATVVFAANQDTALILSHIRAAWVVTLSESARLTFYLSHLLHHYGLLLGTHGNHPWLTRHHSRLCWHHPGLSWHHTRLPWHHPWLPRHHPWLSRYHVGYRHHARLSRHAIWILLLSRLTLH